MSKSQKTQARRGHFGRGIATLSLAATLVASAACTTNQTRGDGEPLRVTPAVGPNPPSATPGSSGGSGLNMTSASERAVTILRERLAYDGRVLGPVNPGNVYTDGSRPTIAGSYSAPPPQMVNPQLTVNSSISSSGVPAVVSGAEGGAAMITSGVSASGAVTASSVSPGINGVGAAGFTSASTGVTGGITAAQVSANANATSSASPVLAGGIFSSVGATPLANTTSNVQSAGATPTLSGTGPNAGTSVATLGQTSATPVAGTTSPSVSTTSAIAPATSLRTTGTVSSGVANPVRIVRSANGAVTVTNSSGGTTDK